MLSQESSPRDVVADRHSFRQQLLMRRHKMTRRAAVFCFICSFSSISFGQIQTGDNPVQSDPAAVQFVAKMISSCGWNLPAPATIVANGTVTVNGNPEPII